MNSHFIGARQVFTKEDKSQLRRTHVNVIELLRRQARTQSQGSLTAAPSQSSGLVRMLVKRKDLQVGASSPHPALALLSFLPFLSGHVKFVRQIRGLKLLCLWLVQASCALEPFSQVLCGHHTQNSGSSHSNAKLILILELHREQNIYKAPRHFVLVKRLRKSLHNPWEEGRSVLVFTLLLVR